MLTDTCQRYTEGRESRRPAGEVIRTSEYDAEEISPTLAIAFVERHHYAHSCSSTSHTFGLFHRGELAGTAVFGALPSMNAHRAVFPTLCTKTGVTLGRFVLTENVAGNGESWFLARCFELLRDAKVVGVESCADPVHGHVGTIYQATNGDYRGKTNASTRYILPDGTVLSNRSASKLTGGERGAGRAIAQLVRFGATPPGDDENVVAWLRQWRPRICRRKRHYGNHRYVWCLDRKRTNELIPVYGPRREYPKIDTHCKEYV